MDTPKRVVYKYTLNKVSANLYEVWVPKNCDIIKIDTQGEHIRVWVVTSFERDMPLVNLMLEVYATGEPFEWTGSRFLKTVSFGENMFLFHIFMRNNPGVNIYHTI